MTNTPNNSPFFTTPPIPGETISDFFNLPELIGFVVHKAISTKIQQQSSIFDRCVTLFSSELVGVAVSVPESALDAAIRFFGSELVVSMPGSGELRSLLIVDRFRAAPENESRFNDAVTFVQSSIFPAPTLLIKKGDDWQETSFALDQDQTQAVLLSETAGAIAKKASAPERYSQFFATLSSELPFNLSSNISIVDVVSQLLALANAVKDVDKKSLTSFYELLLSDLELSQLKIGDKVDTIPWSLLARCLNLRSTFLAHSGKGQPKLPSDIVTVSLSPAALSSLSLSNAKLEARNLDVLLPAEVVGFQTLSSFLTVEEELTKFFLSLPAAKLTPVDDVQSSARNEKAKKLSAVLYRGWKIDQILQLSISEFITHFRNHPKFRTLSSAILAFDLQKKDIYLTDSLSALSYVSALSCAWVRELRKLREGSKVYIPDELQIFGSPAEAEMMKVALFEFLKFYRAQIVVYCA